VAGAAGTKSAVWSANGFGSQRRNRPNERDGLPGQPALRELAPSQYAAGDHTRCTEAKTLQNLGHKHCLRMDWH
jgi:hypothetical protein